MYKKTMLFCYSKKRGLSKLISCINLVRRKNKKKRLQVDKTLAAFCCIV